MSRVAYAVAALVMTGLVVLVLALHTRAAANCDDAGVIPGRDASVVWIDDSHCER